MFEITLVHERAELSMITTTRSLPTILNSFKAFCKLKGFKYSQYGNDIISNPITLVTTEIFESVETIKTSQFRKKLNEFYDVCYTSQFPKTDAKVFITCCKVSVPQVPPFYQVISVDTEAVTTMILSSDVKDFALDAELSKWSKQLNLPIVRP